MSGFERRSNESSDGYFLNQHVALPIPYSHGDGPDFSVNEHGVYPFAHQAFGAYAHQFASPYSHPPISSHTPHLSTNQSPGQSTPPASDHIGLQHHPIQYMSQPRYLQAPRYLPLGDTLGSTEIESQDSRNESTMLSEPVLPPLDGFPNVREFDQLMKSYVDDLSIKKQDKALIHARRARNIRTVLLDPKDTAIESAQFRFWVKKMFKLQVVGSGSPDGTRMICHEGKPVAVREKLFKILTRAHQQCQHGGRDKTSAQVRQIYSWVPKELISRFVKICPTCQVRRGGSRLTPPNSRRSSPRLDMVSRSPSLPSPPISRRESILHGHMVLERSQTDYVGQFSGHSSWVDSQRSIHERPTSVNLGPLRSLGASQIPPLPNTMTAALDSFTGDMPVSSSHAAFGPEFDPTNGQPSHRDF